VSLRRVRKRDGREVAFERGKIAAAVRSAQGAVGEEDSLFAEEVADLVELALRRRYAWRGESAGQEELAQGESFMTAGGAGGTAESEPLETIATESVPDIEEIQDLVEIGLVELGRAAVAKAYILYRDRRTRARDALEATASDEAAHGALRGLRVREAGGSFPWSKGRIVAALVQEANLSRTQATEVAGRVEARVVASGLKRISTALIRELVDNELVSMGLSGALLRQAPVSIPRHDLRELLERGPQAAALGTVEGGPSLAGVRQLLGAESLSRYVLADVFDEPTAELHLGGALHIEDTGAPHLHLVQAVDASLLLRGAPGPAAAFDALEEVVRLFGSVSRGVLLENPSGILRSIHRAPEGEHLRAWLLSLGSVAKGAGRCVDLVGFGGRGIGLAARLVEELDGLFDDDPARGLPRVLLERRELAAVLEAGTPDTRTRAERLLACGLLVPTWAPEGERYLGPAGRRPARERGALACGGAVALNLARVALHAGPWREDLLLEGIAHLVEQGVEALAQLARFQTDCRAARSGEARGRVAYSLVPVGLCEALRLVGDGELRPDQGSRLLGLCSEGARRFARERGLSLHLGVHHGGAAGLRFAGADAGAERVRQGLLFDAAAEEQRSGAATVRGYSHGYALGALPGQVPGRAQAQLLATVPAGSWQPIEFDREGGETPQLDAFELFTAERETIQRCVSSAVEIPRTAPIFPLDHSSPQVS
jgi:hypothetical protein